MALCCPRATSGRGVPAHVPVLTAGCCASVAVTSRIPVRAKMRCERRWLMALSAELTSALRGAKQASGAEAEAHEQQQWEQQQRPLLQQRQHQHQRQQQQQQQHNSWTGSTSPIDSPPPLARLRTHLTDTQHTRGQCSVSALRMRWNVCQWQLCPTGQQRPNLSLEGSNARTS